MHANTGSLIHKEQSEVGTEKKIKKSAGTKLKSQIDGIPNEARIDKKAVVSELIPENPSKAEVPKKKRSASKKTEGSAVPKPSSSIVQDPELLVSENATIPKGKRPKTASSRKNKKSAIAN